MGNKLCATWQKGYHEAGLPWPHRKEPHRIRLWAEIFEVREENGQMFWGRVSDDLVPVNIVCVQDTPSTVYQITAYNSLVKKIFDIRLVQPGTLLVQPSDCFIHWRDVETGHEWGLNFTTASDARQFRDCCMSRVPPGLSRKASSSESLRPKSRKEKLASASVRLPSNHSSPQHARCAAMSSSLQETGNDVSHYGQVAEPQYCAASSQRHCAECSRHCCVKQQVQLVSVYVNNWCGADGEQADSSSSDYNTLPHYQRYQRCLQHQQQACLGHYHTGQRAQLMYETVGRSANCVEGARATLCSRHGRSNSLSPGRARYAAGQLCSAARLRRPLMPPGHSETAPAAEIAAALGTSAVEEQATTSSASPAQRRDTEQSTSSTVDDAQHGISARDNAEVCDLITAEPNNVDSELEEVPLSDNVDGDAKQSELPPDAGQPSDAVTDSGDLSTDAERCTEKSWNDDEVVETDKQNIAMCIDIRTLNEEEATATNDDHSVITNDVVDGYPVVGEISSKDWVAGAAADDGWSSKSPVIRFDQADTTSAKFDSSALEKILSSLSATSRHDHDGLTTNDCNHDDGDGDDDEVWMRRDVDDACQSSLSMLDAAVERLDNGLHFKSRRRRSSCSSSSSSSVGHCSPSCLIPPSTLDADTDTSTSLLLSCVTNVDTSTDAAATSTCSTSTNVPPTSTSVEPAEVDQSSQTAGKGLRDGDVSSETASDPVGFVDDTYDSGEHVTATYLSTSSRINGWLSVKKWLTHQDHKVQLVPDAAWKRCWASIRGGVLELHPDEKSCENRSRRHSSIVVEGGLVQVDTGQLNAENTFSLCTACGDVFLLHVEGAADVTAWTIAIHTACAASLARHLNRDSTIRLLQSKMRQLEISVDLDVKMKRLAARHVTTTTSVHSRQAVHRQLRQWDCNLHRLRLAHYRYACYVASLHSVELPNPLMLMCEVSKSVKETLQSTVGCVNAASFHALVSSQSDSTGHVTQQVPATSLLQQTSGDLVGVGAEMSTFKAATSSSIAIQRMSLPNRHVDFTSDSDVSAASAADSGCESSSRQLAENPVSDDVTDDEHQQRMMRSDHELDFGMMLEAKLVQVQSGPTSLRVFVRDVARSGAAQRHGVKVGNELVTVEGMTVSELDMIYIESILKASSSVDVTLRSVRAATTNQQSSQPPSEQNLPSSQHSQVVEVAAASSSAYTASHSASDDARQMSKDIPDLLQTRSTEYEPPPSQHRCVVDGAFYTTLRPLPNSQRIRKIILELLDTERQYVRDLVNLIHRYLEPLRNKTFLSHEEMEQLFGSVYRIFQFHRLFLQSLENIIEQTVMAFGPTDDILRDEILRRILLLIGSLFVCNAQHFKLYSLFCACHSRMQKLIFSDASDLQDFLRSCNPRQQLSVTFESYLIKPIQRILKYPLLLRQLMDLTEAYTDEHRHLAEALRDMQAVAEHMNEMQKIYDEYGAVFDALSSDGVLHCRAVNLSVSELQMYGTVKWLNASDALGKIKKNVEMLTVVFIFKSAVVLLAHERIKTKKKSKLLSSQLSRSSNGTYGTSGGTSGAGECVDLLRYRLAMPVHQIQVRTVIGDPNQRHAVWEIAYCRLDNCNRPCKTVYQFLSSHKARNDFIRTIHHTMHDNVYHMPPPAPASAAAAVTSQVMSAVSRQQQQRHDREPTVSSSSAAAASAYATGGAEVTLRTGHVGSAASVRRRSTGASSSSDSTTLVASHYGTLPHHRVAQADHGDRCCRCRNVRPPDQNGNANT